jgi:tripartite-type tricarboxylate transporter receptor subunit TctC
MRRLLLTLPALLACLMASPPQAQTAGDWPARSIRLVVPFGAGGPPDVLARIMAQPLSEGLGQSVIIDNRVGAGGTLGAELVARAPADGYTLLLGATSTMAIGPSVYRELRYDPVRDFEPVGLATTAPFLVAVHPSLPVRSLRELIELARARPGTINFGSSGNATPLHIAGEMFRAATGVNMVHIPYKDIGPATNDFLTGRFQVMFQQLAPLEQHVTAGRIHILAVADRRRLPQLPNVPSSAELGLEGFEVISWFGLFAPRGTPVPIVRRVNAELQRILGLPAVRSAFDKLGVAPQGGSPEQFSRFIAAQIPLWSEAVRKSGARID